MVRVWPSPCRYVWAMATSKAAKEGSAAGEVRPVVIRIPADLHEAIKRKAASEDRSMAQTMRHALRVYAADAAPA
jgi:predicted HicB family RNase H-like nuclease